MRERCSKGLRGEVSQEARRGYCFVTEVTGGIKTTYPRNWRFAKTPRHQTRSIGFANLRRMHKTTFSRVPWRARKNWWQVSDITVTFCVCTSFRQNPDTNVTWVYGTSADGLAYREKWHQKKRYSECIVAVEVVREWTGNLIIEATTCICGSDVLS